MTPERWETIKEVFEAALELEGHSRAAFLDQACVGESSLRAEVVELIASHEQAAGFMAAAAFEPAITHVAGHAEEWLVGCRIGSYRTTREIGHGGMGAVFLAFRADEEYRKEVAIKVIKRGMDTDAVLRNLRKERQILATLDHANIVTLFDGGTTDDGLPYFVMDYVEGLPLDVYCDKHRLSIAERLMLFRTICSAVHYAHQHGVIHRDLKPDNILVTPEGVPKLLDFGIAKVLNADPSSATMVATGTAVGPLTPAYASPEQIRGQEIAPASDVYSLGVVLYELLTGHRPHRFHSYASQEIERVVCEEEPEKPSAIINRTDRRLSTDGSSLVTITPEAISEARHDTPERLRHRLAGDLDNIVLMALRKEPGRRYSSVAQFADDIRRHLEGRPVIGRKDTVPYRTAKFVQRNRASVITVSLSLTVILGLIGIGLYPFPLGNSAPDKTTRIAVLPFQPLVVDARDEYLEFGITDGLVRELSHLRQLTVRSTQSVLKYGKDGGDPLAAARDLRVDALVVGRVHRAGDRTRLSVQLIGARDGSVLWAEKFDEQSTAVEGAIATRVARALALRLTGAERQRLGKRDTTDPKALQEYMIGRHHWNQFGTTALKIALQHFEKAAELDPMYALAHAGVADAYASFATYRVISPVVAYPKARAAAETALKLDDELSEAHSTLALVNLYHDWNWPAAERAFGRAVQLNSVNAEAHTRYALALTWFERFDDALREIRRAGEIDPLLRRINVNAAQILYHAGRYDQAVEEVRKGLTLDPNFYQNHQKLGWVYVQTRAYDNAIAAFKKAIDLNANPQVEADLAHAYAVSGRSAEATQILERLVGRSAQNYFSPFDIAVVYAGLGDRDQAFAWLEKAFAERSRPMLGLKINPRLDPLRSDPRFAMLIRRMRVFDAN